MIRWIDQGNIFNIDGVDNFAHGCNCAGAMGKGVAVQFREKFPQMYEEYKMLCRQYKFSLGDVFAYQYDMGTVFNLATQKTWRDKADLNAIKQSLKTMSLIASNKGIKKIALPKIGSGLGGLEWAEVQSVLETIAKDFSDLEFYVVRQYK